MENAKQAQATSADNQAEARITPGSEIIWDTLVHLGVETIFGYPGGAIMPAYDSMIKFPIHHVLVRHEQGAAHMADGFARVSGKVGVCVATSGPGATNLVTGIANAMLDGIPMVAITGQVASSLIGSDAFQETDITGVTLPITKHNIVVDQPEDISEAIKEAFYIAQSGRPGPVVVDITKDAQQKSCLYKFSDAPVQLPGYRPEFDASAADIALAVEMMKNAERPVIFCGHGIVRSDSSAELMQLVEKTNIPVASTLLGLGGFPASHERALGMMGMHGEAWVNRAIQEADLLIALGMRFDDRVTGNPRTYAPHAKKIHVELDPSEIGKVVQTDVGICGDVAEVLKRLTPKVAAQARTAWNTHIDQGRAHDMKRDIIATQPVRDAMLAADVIHALYELTEGGAIMVSDVGQHQMWEAQYYKHGTPRQLLTSGGLGTMGFALPAAMGAALAKPDAEIWVVAGDGGFQMTACELSTCAEHGLNINVAIVNNGYLGMVRQWQEFFFDRRYVSTPMHSPDFVKLADAHGLNARRVERRDDIAEAVAFARADKGTTVVEFRVQSEDNVFPMVATGKDLHDMIRRPDGSEDAP